MNCKTFFQHCETFQPPLEENSGEVVTVPDMSLSVKDILRRFSRGTIDLNSLNRNLPYGNDDIDDDSLDGVTDVFSHIDNSRFINDKINRLTSSLESQKVKDDSASSTSPSTDANVD